MIDQLETVLGQIQSMHSQLQSDAAKFGVTQEGIWVETDSMVESIDDGIYQVGQGSATAHVTTLTGEASLYALRLLQDGQCQINFSVMMSPSAYFAAGKKPIFL